MDRPDAAVDPPLVPIEDYAVLGDGKTAALVSLRGSVDWMCLPTFDSAACFARLLGTSDNGRWLLTVRDATSVTRRYLDDSFVLETTYETADGTAVAQETMPLNDGRADLVRRLVCTRGTVEVEHEWVVRFGYGSVEPWVRRVTDDAGNDAIRAIAGPDSLLLRGDRLPVPDDHRHADRFTLREGESVELALTWTRSWDPVPPRLTIEDRIDSTRISWGLWARSCAYTGSYREAVVRSLLVLRMLTDSETGGIVAAATTSLPEDFGGERNWDYRFCWLRDAAFVMNALLQLGCAPEADAFFWWLMHASQLTRPDMQVLYRLNGDASASERTMHALDGYRGSRPVRVGNGAVDQRQLDIYGEVCGALHQARRQHLLAEDTWPLQLSLLTHLESIWREPDNGLWESRGPRRHFTFSKVMAWVAFSRSIEDAEDFGLEAPVERWKGVRDEIHTQVCQEGFDAEKNSFVQSYGAKALDASLLLIPVVGFLPGHDKRVVGTIAAVERELMADGFVLRYRTEQAQDGLPGHEGAFLACSFWLAAAMHLQGREDDARALFERLIALRNDVGLLSEEYDPVAKRFTGNFPQAFSHVALVTTAMLIGGLRPSRSKKSPAHQGDT